MELYHYVLVSLTPLVLVVPVCSTSLSSCPRPPQCDQGYGLKNCMCVRCVQDQYWVVKSRLPRCDRCPAKCSGDRNLKEVIPCGPTQSRVCHCDRGFFCESKAQFSCRRCQPCPAGTFSNKISMEESCQPYTDCVGHSLAVNSSGTSTRDQLCSSPIMSIRTHPDAPVGNADTTQSSAPVQTIPLPVTPHERQSTSQQPAMYRTVSAVSSPINGQVFEESASSSVFLLILGAVLVSAAMLLMCSMWRKHDLLKRKDWPCLKCLQEQGRKEDPMGGDLYFVSQGLLGNTTGNTQQESPPKQQVTMDHSGGGDSVSNNVGSIYIYSPKMVVLGTNTSERKEEVKLPGEEVTLPGEELAPLRTPHQEQGPAEHPVTTCVQEEEGKELSYPVPATSK